MNNEPIKEIENVIVGSSTISAAEKELINEQLHKLRSQAQRDQEDKEQQITPYNRKDLNLKEQALACQRKALTAARISLCISILGFAAVWHSLKSNDIALQKNGLALRNNVQQSMTKLVVDLDRVYIDHPELRQYFNEGLDAHGTTNFVRASALAVTMLDVFDVAIGQCKTFREEWTEPDGWTNWVVNEFANSSFLRGEYWQRTNWYGPDMLYLVIQSTNKPNHGPSH